MNNPWLKTKTHEVFLMFVDRETEMTRRLYPKALMEECIKNLKPQMENRTLLGHLDHQEDSIIHLSEASHLVLNLKIIEKALWAEIEILDSPNGRILEMMLQANPDSVVFATAGLGNGTVNEAGILVLGENYKLITVNAVPSDGSGKFNNPLRRCGTTIQE